MVDFFGVGVSELLLVDGCFGAQKILWLLFHAQTDKLIYSGLFGEIGLVANGALEFPEVVLYCLVGEVVGSVGIAQGLVYLGLFI